MFTAATVTDMSPRSRNRFCAWRLLAALAVLAVYNWNAFAPYFASQIGDTEARTFAKNWIRRMTPETGV